MNSQTATAPGHRRHRMARFALAAAALGASFTVSVAVLPSTADSAGGPTVKLITHGGLGKILVNSAGMTLYRFTADRPNQAVCTGSCAGLWPPLLIAKGTKPSGTKGLGTVSSGDKLQVTFNKHPLYTYTLDTGPGSTSGQGVTDHGGTWFVATSTLKVATTKASSTGGSSGGYGY